MPDLDVLSDTDLRERAAEILETFFHEHDPGESLELKPGQRDEIVYPVTRSQVVGLRQIACNEPATLQPFARKQGDKARERLEKLGDAEKHAAKRLQLQSQVDFWKLVADLAWDGSGARPKHWTLREFAESQLPEELGAAAGAGLMGKAKADFNARRRAELEERKRPLAPAFFQRFCAHYLYKKP